MSKYSGKIAAQGGNTKDIARKIEKKFKDEALEAGKEEAITQTSQNIVGGSTDVALANSIEQLKKNQGEINDIELQNKQDLYNAIDSNSTNSNTSAEQRQEKRAELEERLEDVHQKKQDAIEEENENFEKQKEQAKQNYQDRVRKINEGPPAWLGFFLWSGWFWILMVLDSAFSLIPYLGTVLQYIPTIIGIVFYAIPLILMGNPITLILIAVFYLVDLSLSVVFNIVGTFFPALGDVIDAALDLLTEIIVAKIGVAPYQMLHKSVDNYQLTRLDRAEHKFEREMKQLQTKHDKRLQRINDKFSNLRLNFIKRMYVDVPIGTQKTVTFISLAVVALLSWWGFIGIDFVNPNLTQLMFSGLVLAIVFFLQRMGLIPDE